MTNKKFVLSIHKDAFCNEEVNIYNGSMLITFIIYSDQVDKDTTELLGYSDYSTTIAWRSAARFLRKQMLEKLEQ